jgi:FkbM family methyltransferase
LISADFSAKPFRKACVEAWRKNNAFRSGINDPVKIQELAPWLPNYIKTWGLIPGSIVFARIVRLAAQNFCSIESIRIPDFEQTIWLRAGLHDISIFQQVWLDREYDLRQTPHFARLEASYQRILANGRRPLIIDCGSHIGMSVLWWRRMFPEAQIVAIEPSVANLSVLCRNVEGFDNVTVLHGGVWHQGGTLSIQNPDAGMAGFRLGETTTAEGTVRAYTIAEIMADSGCQECLLVKIDIEGGEASLFEENLAWLDQTHCLAVELHDWLNPWSGSSRSLFRATSERHFDYLLRGENILCFQHLPPSLSKTDTRIGVDTIAAP